MDKNKPLILILGVVSAAAVVGLVIFLYTSLRPREVQLDLTPKPLPEKEAVAQLSGTEVGTGMSGKSDPKEAVKEAGDMALKGKLRQPDIAIVFVNATANAAAVLSEARNYFGPDVKIFGSTSSARGVMSDKGIVATEGTNFSKEYLQATNGLVLMTIASKDITFGVSTVPFTDVGEAKKAAVTALAEAQKDAGKGAADLPKAILMASVRPLEDAAIEGIESVLGKDAVILGGTAGGPTPAIFGKDGVYSQAVSLAVLYTDLPVGTTFGNSFDYPDLKSGTVTKAEGMEIMEIDGKPALDVLDGWLDGAIEKMHLENSDPRVVRDMLALQPIYRKLKSADGKVNFVISHPWPKDDKMLGRTILTATHIKVGEQIFLGRGSVESLMNGIAGLPRAAKQSVGMDMSEQPVLAIGFVCNGALGVIPETERMKLPKLIGVEAENVPYLVVFSYGEQALVPGYGNVHVNLSSSFLVIGQGKKR